MGEKMLEDGVAYIAPGRGKSVWIGDRELVTFKQTGADTGGLFALVEVVGLPGSGPPPHFHHRADEVYRLLEEAIEVLDGSCTFAAEAGSVFRIHKGTLHVWRNVTTSPARMLLFISPAGFEGFFEEAGVSGTDLSSPPPPTPEDFQRLPEICGDRAEVRDRVPTSSLLVRVGGKWLLLLWPQVHKCRRPTSTRK